MKHNITLTITSLLSILLMTFHLSDDVVRGFEPGGFKNVSGVLILVVWLCGTLVLAGRRSGYIIILLLGSLLGSVVPLAHMRGAGLVGGRIANSSGKLFWGLDAHRARRDRGRFRHPLGARTVEPATVAVHVVQLVTVHHSAMLLQIHIVGGVLAMILGAVALLARKGATLHRRSGQRAVLIGDACFAATGCVQRRARSQPG
jgi:hypothetical protein